MLPVVMTYDHWQTIELHGNKFPTMTKLRFRSFEDSLKHTLKLIARQCPSISAEGKEGYGGYMVMRNHKESSCIQYVMMTWPAHSAAGDALDALVADSLKVAAYPVVRADISRFATPSIDLLEAGRFIGR